MLQIAIHIILKPYKHMGPNYILVNKTKSKTKTKMLTNKIILNSNVYTIFTFNKLYKTKVNFTSSKFSLTFSLIILA